MKITLIIFNAALTLNATICYAYFLPKWYVAAIAGWCAAFTYRAIFSQPESTCQKWEYMIFRQSFDEMQKLNELGALGWEIVFKDDAYNILLKREAA